MQTILASLLAQALEHAPEVVLFLLTGVVFPFLIRWLRLHTTLQQQAVIAGAADVVVFALDTIAKKTDTKLDDQLVEGVKMLKAQLAPKGVKLSDETAKMILQAAASSNGTHAAG